MCPQILCNSGEGRSLTTHLWAYSKISANNARTKKLELREMANLVFSPVKFISCPNKRNQLHSRKYAIPKVSTGIIHNLQDVIQRAQHTENITPSKETIKWTVRRSATRWSRCKKNEKGTKQLHL